MNFNFYENQQKKSETPKIVIREISLDQESRHNLHVRKKNKKESTRCRVWSFARIEFSASNLILFVSLK